MILTVGTDVFEAGCDLIDVTSLHRPNVASVVVDAKGHTHPWCLRDGTPARHYSPSESYVMPSVVWVKDGEEWYPDDDEPHDVGHHECRLCGEHITPPYTADTTSQHVAGLRWFRINGLSVTPEEFAQRYEASRERHR